MDSDPDDDEMLFVFEGLLELPDDDPDKLDCLEQFDEVLADKFLVSGDLNLLGMQISILEAAINLIPDGDPRKLDHRNNLANTLLRRFWDTADDSDLSRSISIFQEIIPLTPKDHPDLPSRLSNYGCALSNRFTKGGDRRDIDKSISMHNEAIRLSHSAEPELIFNLGNSHLRRFEHFGDRKDLDKSIAAQQDAVRLVPTQAKALNNLGNALLSRFKLFENPDDVQSAISAFRNALQHGPDHLPDKIHFLSNLGNALHFRFQRLGGRHDIDEAIASHKEAVQLTSDRGLTKASRLGNLGCSFDTRFASFGDLEDIENAISYHLLAVECTPNGHSELPVHLSNLGSSYLARFWRLNQDDDIEKSVSALDRAVKLAPDGHADMPCYLSGLGNALSSRFRHSLKPTDIEDAISFQERAVNLTKDDDSAKSTRLNSLGNSLIYLEHSDDSDHIKRAISTHERAVQLTPDNHPEMPRYLNSLAFSFYERFISWEDPADLDRAVLEEERAIKLIPDHHRDKTSYQNSLGKFLLERIHRSPQNDDLDKAREHLSCAARSSTGDPSARFEAALQWASIPRLSRESMFEAYKWALDLMPRLAWLGLPMDARHSPLARFKTEVAVRDAVATAIDFGKLETAVEWLEQGRSIVWGQLLQLRTPVDDLSEEEPELAKRFITLSNELNIPQTDPLLRQNVMALEVAARRQSLLTLEWESLVEKIRRETKFKHFLLPKPMSELYHAGRHGPVVVLNTSKLRCDALVVTSCGVRGTRLEHFTLQEAQDMQTSLKAILASHGIQTYRRPHRRQNVGANPNVAIEKILSGLWLHVVEPVLNDLSLKTPSTEELSRLWWCPTGSLMFLPIHAAGIYDAAHPGPALSDFVVSSYAPTLSALIASHECATSQDFKLLVVALSETHDKRQPRLPNTLEEAKKILLRARNLASHVTMLESPAATVEHVLRCMEDHNWVHFACHGVQEIDHPVKSGLLLQDSRLKLSEIIGKSLPNAEFAFLSACQTATGTDQLSEEAVHLAAGMLLAGYRGVAATMWSIVDDIAPLVVDRVYEHLFRAGRPDRGQAAYALHHAVQDLRKRPGVPFVTWVPFMHLGM